jgi:hypothetical protein
LYYILLSSQGLHDQKICARCLSFPPVDWSTLFWFLLQ